MEWSFMGNLGGSFSMTRPWLDNRGSIPGRCKDYSLRHGV